MLLSSSYPGTESYTCGPQFEEELRKRMRQFDPRVPVVDLETVNEQIGFSLRTERLLASLSTIFGGVATMLAVIGLCGVMAYAVSRRTREIGIRIALGALRGNVIAVVMREVFLLIGAGLAAGIAMALALADLIRSQLFGLNARDPFSLVSSAIILAVAAGLAGLLFPFLSVQSSRLRCKQSSFTQHKNSIMHSLSASSGTADCVAIRESSSRAPPGKRSRGTWVQIESPGLFLRDPRQLPVGPQSPIARNCGY